MLEILYALACLAMLVYMLFQCGYSFNAFPSIPRPRVPARDVCPLVALVTRCKGLAPDLDKTLRRHFAHDSPDYQVVFSVADPDDPAVPVIQKILQTEKAH